MFGQEGIGRKNKVIKARTIKEGCKDDCRFKCHSKISQVLREHAFNKFWSLPTRREKWDCILKWVEATPLKRKSEPYDSADAESDENSGTLRPHQKFSKEITHKYQLPLGFKMQKVCKKMFLDTLGKLDEVSKFLAQHHIMSFFEQVFPTNGYEPLTKNTIRHLR